MLKNKAKRRLDGVAPSRRPCYVVQYEAEHRALLRRSRGSPHPSAPHTTSVSEAEMTNEISPTVHNDTTSAEESQPTQEHTVGTYTRIDDQAMRSMIERRVSRSAILLYWALCSHCYNHKSDCFPGTNRLSSMTGMTGRSVGRARKELATAGLIRTAKTRGRSTLTYHLPGRVTAGGGLLSSAQWGRPQRPPEEVTIQRKVTVTDTLLASSTGNNNSRNRTNEQKFDKISAMLANKASFRGTVPRCNQPSTKRKPLVSESRSSSSRNGLGAKLSTGHAESRCSVARKNAPQPSRKWQSGGPVLERTKVSSVPESSYSTATTRSGIKSCRSSGNTRYHCSTYRNRGSTSSSTRRQAHVSSFVGLNRTGRRSRHGATSTLCGSMMPIRCFPFRGINSLTTSKHRRASYGFLFGSRSGPPFSWFSDRGIPRIAHMLSRGLLPKKQIFLSTYPDNS